MPDIGKAELKSLMADIDRSEFSKVIEAIEEAITTAWEWGYDTGYKDAKY